MYLTEAEALARVQYWDVQLRALEERSEVMSCKTDPVALTEYADLVHNAKISRDQAVEYWIQTSRRKKAKPVNLQQYAPPPAIRIVRPARLARPVRLSEPVKVTLAPAHSSVPSAEELRDLAFAMSPEEQARRRAFHEACLAAAEPKPVGKPMPAVFKTEKEYREFWGQE